MTAPTHYAFDTKAQAIAAGFVQAKGIRHAYRGFCIYSTDTSGYPNFGYRFSIEACFEASRNFLGYEAIEQYRALRGAAAEEAFNDRAFADSTSVSLRHEKNRVGDKGCFSVMFAPDALAAGMIAARDAIDAWFDANPTAADAMRDLDHDEATRALARAEKDAARRERRALQTA